MGLAFEVIFLFFAINYWIIKLLSEKSKELDRELEIDQGTFCQKRALADFKKNACIVEDDSFGSDQSENIDIERECIELFRTLPSWRNKTDWGIHMKKTEHDSSYNMHVDIARIIFYANRGKIPKDLLYLPGGRILYVTPTDNYAAVYELMLWWRNKIRSFGLKHELWFVYYEKGRRCRCPVEFAWMREGGGCFCWDAGEEIRHLFVKLPGEEYSHMRAMKIAREVEASCAAVEAVSDFQAGYGLPVHKYAEADPNKKFKMRLPTSREIESAVFLGRDLPYISVGVEDYNADGAKYPAQVFLCNGRGGLVISKNPYKPPTDISRLDGMVDFIPAFDLIANEFDEIMSYTVGETYVVGTAYVEGEPIVPGRNRYNAASVVELCEPASKRSYHIEAIYIGDNVFVATETIFGCIQYSDIKYALTKAEERAEASSVR